MRIIQLLKKKLSSKRGETFTETLASLLIIVPAMVMLAGAIVSAARINLQARNTKASELPKYTATSQNAVKCMNGSGAIDLNEITVNWCKDDSDSVYYYFR